MLFLSSLILSRTSNPSRISRISSLSSKNINCKSTAFQ